MMIGSLLVAAVTVFSAAKPVWVEGETETMNTFFRFKTTFEATSPATLKVSAGYNYRVKLNGKFVGYGPIRAPEGYAFVDEWRLPSAAGGKRLEIESAGYNCNSYYMLDQPPFLVAELSVGGKVVAATGKDGGFKAYPTGRVRKVQRFSYQRTFLESYVVNDATDGNPLPLVEMAPKRWLERPVAYPDFARSAFRPFSRHRLTLDPKRKGGSLWHVNGCANLKMYRKDELASDPFDELSRYGTVARDPLDAAAGSVRLAAGEQAIYEGPIDESGFIGVTVRSDGPCRVIVTFDELLDEKGDVDFRRLGCGDILEWKLEKGGTHALESFEPYAGKYVGVMVMEGAAEVTDVAVRTYKSPAADRASFKASDPALEKIFLAARESFRANAVDSLTDCPIRERSCWTGDTFFTGRGAGWLTGEPSSERLFLENFLMPEKFDWSHYKTEGRDYSDTIPALYPGSIYGGNFISNYTMWFILQVEEYVRRYGDRAFAERFRPRILRMVRFLRQFRNADGLLEKLPGWVFVEWSKANELVQDVNYPSSMMYAAALDAVARMYGLAEYADEARRVKREIVRQSWTGEWFCDNAVRLPDGSLKLSGECTETCQYCAFFFGTVTPASHPDLWNRLLDEFGPDRVAKGVHKRIWPCNFIFGTCERLELLSRAGRSGQILSETRDFFLKMAERTGTLWEHLDTRASCCHGFACIASEYLFRDILGVRAVDRTAKTVRFAPPKDVDLDWCEGVLPLSATETARFRWTRMPEGPKPVCSLPSGWKAD